ncbi:MAG: Endonuclease V [Candidatus Ozemobacter sibiricus]|jgi:deoxyribonuclease V|uniref:Endonuclease V n=1 Tax=Candidatus Ozemobacter sibiricus TaxID=2268124 RepID=A0A367ZRN8_9BACT|nr:MAG: Endonuclease V [Candidatus Ozemobacter sibiricus]
MPHHIDPLHPWNIPLTEAAALQQELAARLVFDRPVGPIRWVAGVDGSYRRFCPDMWVAVVVWDAMTGETVEQVALTGRVPFPYVPGFLSFREGPLVLQAFERLQHWPDAVLFDGQGIAHPRGLGLASHLGLWLDLPSVGVAKSRLCGEAVDPLDEPGAWSPLELSGRTVGAVLRTRTRCRPLYVSPGHRIDLAGALDLVQQCLRGYRLPEPTRLAHHAVSAARRAAARTG